MKEQIIKLLSDYNAEDVARFANYCHRLQVDKKKDGTLKNKWATYIKADKFAELFKTVDRDGLVFDGINITLQSTGISYNYIAYKNKMLLAYPDSIIDVNLVHQGDTLKFNKDSGKVNYTHNIADPFGNAEIIGGYCVIKNKRGEFMTLLSRADIDKHRKTAKTDYIWQAWFTEMALKTIIKKACKLHFADIYSSVEQTDNENYNVDNPLDIDIELKAKIDECKTVKDLEKIYKDNKGAKGLTSYLAIKKNELNEQK